MAIQYGTSGPVVTFTYIYIYLQDVPVFVHEAAGNSGLSDAQPIVWLLVVFLGLVQWRKALGVM